MSVSGGDDDESSEHYTVCDGCLIVLLQAVEQRLQMERCLSQELQQQLQGEDLASLADTLHQVTSPTLPLQTCSNKEGYTGLLPQKVLFLGADIFLFLRFSNPGLEWCS